MSKNSFAVHAARALTMIFASIVLALAWTASAFQLHGQPASDQQVIEIISTPERFQEILHLTVPDEIGVDQFVGFQDRLLDAGIMNFRETSILFDAWDRVIPQPDDNKLRLMLLIHVLVHYLAPRAHLIIHQTDTVDAIPLFSNRFEFRTTESYAPGPDIMVMLLLVLLYIGF